MVNADELFGGAEKLKAFSRKLDFQTETSPWREPKKHVIPPAPKFGMPTDWVVVKNVGEKGQTVGLNLTERDAKILAASQTAKLVPNTEDGEKDLLLISYQVMTEEKAKKEGLIK